MTRRHVITAAGLLGRLDLDDPVHRHAAVEQAAQFTAVLALRWPADRADGHQRHVADAVCRAADDLAAATRLWRPSPARRSQRPRPLLPVLATLALHLARTGDTEPVLALLVLAVLAVLVIALADHVTGTGRPAPVRGEPGAHLRAAADHLRPYQRRTTTTPTASTTTSKNPAAQVVDVGRRLAASAARLIGRPVPGVDPRRDANPTRPGDRG
ncbi:hypothetical protein [Umezawaea sp. Da 62-37]|uniref:hypothetical protein n=1 Tax=Umezawaea sp. Da 62-37 TaxID=3075927 RepID=UPI0028F6DEE4|nr:hypothetical protein [Umezawaea sp. Da 62-37]WNV84891.1 hypothetical protein RM788_43150 [Umezawaea sp. Da 62-37]